MTRLGAATKRKAKTLPRIDAPETVRTLADDGQTYSESVSIQVGRPDMLDLAQRAAQEMLDKDEYDQRKRAHEAPELAPNESWGIIAKKLFTGPKGDYWEGQVLGTLPGADGPTIVHARTCQGLEAMAHRAYLSALTEGNICNAAQARIRAADATFYVSTVL